MRWAGDWRRGAGVATVGLVWAGLIAYGRGRAGLPGLSLAFAGFVVPAALLGLLCMLRRTGRDAAGYGLALLVTAGLFVRSQLRADALAPPLEEWAIAVGGLGGIAIVALLLTRGVKAPPQKGAMLAASLLTLSCLCAPFTKYSRDEPSDDRLPGALFESGAILNEVLPVPPELRIVLVDQIHPGAHGYGHDVFVFAGTAGAPRDRLVEQLTAHYTAQGWPLAPDPDTPRTFRTGCRPVRGLVSWDDHCLMIQLVEGRTIINGAPELPGTVNVFIA